MLVRVSSRGNSVSDQRIGKRTVMPNAIFPHDEVPISDLGDNERVPLRLSNHGHFTIKSLFGSCFVLPSAGITTTVTH